MCCCCCMLWLIDSCQNKVSAEQYHVTIVGFSSELVDMPCFQHDRWPSPGFLLDCEFKSGYHSGREGRSTWQLIIFCVSDPRKTNPLFLFFPLWLILAIWSFAFKAAKIYISWSPRRVETYMGVIRMIKWQYVWPVSFETPSAFTTFSIVTINSSSFSRTCSIILRID